MSAVAEAILVRCVGIAGRVAHRSYVSSYFFSWGHVDLIPAWIWRGVTLWDKETLLSARDHNRRSEFVALDIASEAIVVWLTGVLWGGVFNERYKSVVSEALTIDPVGLRRRLDTILGRRWADRLWEMALAGEPEAVVHRAKPLRRHLLARNLLKRPVRTAAGRLAFIRAEVRLRLRPQVPWFAIADGDVSDIAQAVARVEPVVSGLRTYDWSCAPQSIPGLVRRLREYWGPLVQDRARGRVVVVHQPEPQRHSLWTMVESWLRPQPDRRVDGAAPLKVESWLRDHLVQHSPAQVGPSSVPKMRA